MGRGIAHQARRSFFHNINRDYHFMPSFKDNFQDRLQRANEAKAAALAKLQAKAPLDPEVVAQRKAAQDAREAREAEARAAKKAAIEQAKAEKAARAAEIEASKPAPKTEAEKKAERDARYAARKARK
jgi:hypothetical protein